MYEVIQNLTVKVQGVIKTFPIGCIVNLPEKAAQIFIQQGKLRPLAEELPTGYELSERMSIMGENTEPEQIKPYVTESGFLVIPFSSPEKYHYWKPMGQSVCVTLTQLQQAKIVSLVISMLCDFSTSFFGTTSLRFHG